MNQTTDNFWEAFNNWNPLEPVPVTYRLYHDSDNRPLFYTMEDLPGNYIQVSREDYVVGSMNVRINNGQLTYITTHRFNKLIPSNTGTPCYPHNVCVVVDPAKPHTKWSLKTHDTH
jgi:hypothetical protein